MFPSQQFFFKPFLRMNSRSFIRQRLLSLGLSRLFKGNSTWSYSVVVITPDFESGNLGSNPGKTFWKGYAKRRAKFFIKYL